MNVEYGFKEGARVPRGASPAVIGNRLEELRSKNGGVLTADLILEAAKNQNDPMHSWFDWNPLDAARKWNLSQARQLVSSITVVYRTEGSKETKSVRAYLSVATETAREYRAIIDIQTDERLRDAILERALTELKAFQRKYEDLREFTSIFAELEVIDRRILAREMEATPAEHLPSA